ncbi:MAG TPA: AraC family transcriptional regulator [Halanaerobiales bacterium]|nr:AraC family transcriptional regulator [Halanaerobiales bacterium]
MDSVYEKIDHSNMLPFKCFITSLEGSCYHWHEDYELIFLLKGEFSVWMRGKESLMQAGDLLLVNSKEVHSIQKCQEGNIAFFIQFQPDIFLKLLEVKNRRYYFYFNSTEKKAKIKKDYSYFRGLVASIGYVIFEKKPGYEFHACSDFYRILGDLFLYAIYDVYYMSDRKYNNDDNFILDRLTEFVRENYMEDLKTDDISNQLGVSRSTLYRYLKNKLGISLSSFINYYRIEEARKLLRSTDYTVAHIAGICGYSNQTSFYRAFKRETGMTPNKFREKEGEMQRAEEENDQRIKGYVSYSNQEAYELVREYAFKD